METKKKKQKNAFEIGQEIIKNDFRNLVKNYKSDYPGTKSIFLIRKDLLVKVLNINEQVAGIRFMYGLKDKLNPNSLVLFLIPCASLSITNISTQAILMQDGYLDHLGNRYSIHEISEMMSWYAQSMKNRNTELVYKTITRGNFYGKNSLDKMINTETQFIQYHLGLRDNVIAPIIQSLNKKLVAVNDIYMDLTQPCPNTCDGGPIGDPCMSEYVVENSNELDYYREFRDTKLLELEGGAPLFEMYYFISPIIQKIISSNENSEEKVTNFYNSEIKPFKELLEKGEYQEAVYLLRETLYNLFLEYSLTDEYI